MRKDFKVGKIIKNRLYSSFEVGGLNLDKFLTTLNREGIVVVNARKKTNKKLLLTIKNCYTEKFFAITERLCYNVKRLKYRGGFLPLYYLYRNVGVAVGILVLFCSSFWFGGRILGITYSGDGSVYSAYVNDFLADRGIGKWTAFSSVDLKKLSREIFASSDRFSFVNCTRWGNTLNVKLIAKATQIDRLDKSQKRLVCDVVGVVEKVKVLRGTKMISVGDTVAVGDILVEGVATVNDKVVETGIVASVWVRYQDQFVYRSENDDEEYLAELFASEKDENAIDCKTEKTFSDGVYTYTVTVSYIKVFTPS